MEQARDKSPNNSGEIIATEELMAKVKVVAQSQHAELFSKIVDDFFEQITEEYFSPEDLAEIEEGFAQIRRGKYVTLEKLEKDLGL